MNVSNGGYFFEGERLHLGDCLVHVPQSDFGPGWLHFHAPDQQLVAWQRKDVLPNLASVELEVSQGATAVGFLNYESGVAFDDKLPPDLPSQLPLLWFGIYRSAPDFYRELAPCYDSGANSTLRGEWDREDYALRFTKVKEAIAAGDVYQVNLSSRLQLETNQSLFDLFRSVCGTQPAPYAAFIKGEDWEVASFSPELFFERTGGVVTMQPMKGTRREGSDSLPEMTSDIKSRAENLMIVDMVRNDLGKIAEIGSVVTPTLFEVQTHRTVRQMVSAVEARSSVTLTELLKATFPPASITGAPKVAACQKIHQLESSPREIYCGCIGYVEPGGNARFSVAIRTAWRFSQESAIKYGIGSGLVWDSEMNEEFAECELKAEILRLPARQWELIECFHRDALLDLARQDVHWQRFQKSALAFGVPLCREEFDSVFLPFQDAVGLPTKIRIAARRDGRLSVSVSESSIGTNPLRACLAKSPVSSRDLNLVHKTNSRQVYEKALEQAKGVDEVLLHNERGEICEFTRGNVMVRLGDDWFTPPTEVGCLPGIGIQSLIANGQAKFARLTISQARHADEIQFINSITGRVSVQIDW